MKKKNCVAALCMVTTILTALVPQTNVWAEAPEKQVDIMFLHDIHSHLDSFVTVVDGEDTLVGGVSRIKTLIDEQKSINPDTLVVDAGDFAMGTLVQTVYETEAAELRMLGEIGVEVTTLGNHEFDYMSAGMANMLLSAKNSGDIIPQMLLSNVDWEAMEAAGLTEGQQLLKDAFTEYGFKDYTVISKGDVDIAVMGIFGEDSLACAPTCELLFKNPVEAAKETVAEIEANEDVDMIVCVSHSGTNSDESKSEDEILAKEVPEIDLIVSGHTHTVLEEPIQHGNTYIVSCGEYGKYLGNLSMTEVSEGVWNLSKYELIPVREDVAIDEETQAKVDGFMKSVDTSYLSIFDYAKNDVLATNDITFSTVKEIEDIHVEHNLGDIIADAYEYAVENAEDFSGDPVDVTIAPSGTIRDTYAKGDVTVEDVFNSFSLGIGQDGVPGYPLVECYVTGKELKIIAEIDASISDYMKIARLYTQGLQFNFNPNRMILNKVTDCYLLDDDGNRVEIQDDELYHVVSDMYSAQMLGAVTDMSYGLLSIIPKYADGTPVEDFNTIAIWEGDRELKAWEAIATYMASFEDTDGDGTSNIPQVYASEQGRKVVEDSKNIIELVKNPNAYSVAIVGIVIVVILLLASIVLLVRKVVKRRRV